MRDAYESLVEADKAKFWALLADLFRARYEVQSRKGPRQIPEVNELQTLLLKGGA